MDKVTAYTSHEVFGAKITPMTKDELLHLLRSHVAASKPCVIAYQNMHGLHKRLEDASLEALHRLPQTYVHIDGMPLVLFCKLCGIHATPAHRITLVDLIWPVLSLAADEGWRVYYLGGNDAVVRAGSAAITRRHPTLRLRTHHGYVDGDVANARVCQDIVDFAPQLLLVGMGMGRQERWVLDNLPNLGPASVYVVGACMEYIAGAVRTPPRWMGRFGLEWLFRLSENPGRFWYRYLVEPWFVIAHMTRSSSRSKGGEIRSSALGTADVASTRLSVRIGDNSAHMNEPAVGSASKSADTLVAS